MGHDTGDARHDGRAHAINSPLEIAATAMITDPLRRPEHSVPGGCSFGEPGTLTTLRLSAGSISLGGRIRL